MTQYATIMPQLTEGMTTWCWDSSLGDASRTRSHHVMPQRYPDTDPWKHNGLLMTAVQLARLVQPDDKTYHPRGCSKPVDYYDNYLLSKCSIRDNSFKHGQQDELSKPRTPSTSQSTKRLCAFPRELLQHRSMFELDPCPSTLRELEEISKNQSLMSSSQTESDHKWVCQPYPTCFANQMDTPLANSPSTFTRFTIQELMQQEGCVSPTHYPVDYPSKIVRVECCKPGCKCVLKNESALALKIIPGVTLIRCNWLSAEGDLIQPPISNVLSTTNSTRRSCFIDKQQQQTSQNNDKCYPRTPVIISSCFPGWFEVATSMKHVKSDAVLTTVPVWSSCKAIWRAKPDMFLLHRDTLCYFAMSSEEKEYPLSGLIKADQLTVNLCGDRSASLPSGTVLRPIDCRLCRLSSGEQPMNSRRHRGKTVSMLQCCVVGARALASLSASLGDDLPQQDTLHWFRDGPRLVYLPWDVKSMQCSPVVSANKSSTLPQTKQNMQKAPNEIKAGVHSVLSLLCQYQFPLTVRPVLGFLPTELNSTAKLTRKTDEPSSHITSGTSKNNSVASSLHMEACFHGDLIFLEPIHDLAGEDRKNATLSRSSGHASTENNQFFVVTTDMLANHNFLLAEPTSQPKFMRQLKAHAFRVAHFLCTVHSAEGLAYLIKHLEDITHSCSTGPSHTPLTRTLGPVNVCSPIRQISSSRAQICLDIVASLAAAAEIAQQDYEDIFNDPSYTREVTGLAGCSSVRQSAEQYLSTSCMMRPRLQATRSSYSSLLESEADQMTTLCDELEDIYYYVRNGSFPTVSRSLTTLAHQLSGSMHQLESTTDATRLLQNLPQTSAPISPRLYAQGQNGISTLTGSYRKRSKLLEEHRGSNRPNGTLNPVKTIAPPSTLYAKIPPLKGFATTHPANSQNRGDPLAKISSSNDSCQEYTVSQDRAFVLPDKEYQNAGNPYTMASSHQPIIISSGRGATRLYTNTKTLKLTPVSSLHKPQPVVSTMQSSASSANARPVAVPGTQTSVVLPVINPIQSSCRGACLGVNTLNHSHWLPATSSQCQPPPWIMAQSMNEQFTILPEANRIPELSKDTDQRMHLANFFENITVTDSRTPGQSSTSVRQMVNPSLTSTVNQQHRNNKHFLNIGTEERGGKYFGQVNQSPASGVLHFVPSAMPYHPGRDQATLAMNAVLVGCSPSHPTMTAITSAFQPMPTQPEVTNSSVYQPQQPTVHSMFHMAKGFNNFPTATSRTKNCSLDYQGKTQPSLRYAAIGSGSNPVAGSYTIPRTYLYTTPAVANAGCNSRCSEEHAQSGIAWTEHFTSSSPDTGIGIDSGGETGNPSFGNPWQQKRKLDRLLSTEQLAISSDALSHARQNTVYRL